MNIVSAEPRMLKGKYLKYSNNLRAFINKNIYTVYNNYNNHSSMSFYLYNTQKMDLSSNDVNVREHYAKLGEEFSKHYYTIYDNNFDQLGSVFSENPYITFLNDKLGSFNEFRNRARQHNIYKFHHYNLCGNLQPIDSEKLLITITGKLSINNQIHIYKFIETIILQRTGGNHFLVTNTMFQLVD